MHVMTRKTTSLILVLLFTAATVAVPSLHVAGFLGSHLHAECSGGKDCHASAVPDGESALSGTSSASACTDCPICGFLASLLADEVVSDESETVCFKPAPSKSVLHSFHFSTRINPSSPSTGPPAV